MIELENANKMLVEATFINDWVAKWHRQVLGDLKPAIEVGLSLQLVDRHLAQFNKLIASLQTLYYISLPFDEIAPDGKKDLELLEEPATSIHYLSLLQDLGTQIEILEKSIDNTENLLQLRDKQI